MSKATCKTCGGEVPNHVPSPLDPNGIGDSAHALGKQYDGLREATIASWSRILATYPMTIDMAKDLLEHISTRYIPKAEVLRAINGMHEYSLTDIELLEYQTKTEHPMLSKTKLIEALGLTSKEGE